MRKPGEMRSGEGLLRRFFPAFHPIRSENTQSRTRGPIKPVGAHVIDQPTLHQIDQLPGYPRANDVSAHQDQPGCAGVPCGDQPRLIAAQQGQCAIEIENRRAKFAAWMIRVDDPG